MLEKLDTIKWQHITHAYGATDDDKSGKKAMYNQSTGFAGQITHIRAGHPCDIGAIDDPGNRTGTTTPLATYSRWS